MRSQEVVSIERAVSQNNLIANQIQLENTIPYLTYPPNWPHYNPQGRTLKVQTYYLQDTWRWCFCWDWSSNRIVPCWITLSDNFYPCFGILFKYLVKVFHSTNPKGDTRTDQNSLENNTIKRLKVLHKACFNYIEL